MSFIGELKNSVSRLAATKSSLRAQFNEHGIESAKDLKKAFKENPEFRQSWNRIWLDIAKRDGGKISLTTVLVILGAAFGGLGIAAFGGAIGLPWALVLGLVGLRAGAALDEKRNKNSIV